MSKRVLLSVGAAILLAQGGCLGAYDANTPSSLKDVPQGTSDSTPQVRPILPEDSTALWTMFGDPALIAARVAEEGPLDVSSRRHGCHKFKFSKLGTLLEDFGVNMKNTNVTPAPGGAASLLPLEAALAPVSDPTTFCSGLVPGQTSVTNAMERATRVSQPARYLYCSGRLTLGMPPYAARLAESTVLTTAAVTKLFDTWAAAAMEIVQFNPTTFTTSPRCKTQAGAQGVLFNADNTCNAEGVACLQGFPPSAEQLTLCNKLVVSGTASPATTVTLQTTGSASVAAVDALTAGKRMAVAAILANAHLCE